MPSFLSYFGFRNNCLSVSKERHCRFNMNLKIGVCLVHLVLMQRGLRIDATLELSSSPKGIRNIHEIADDSQSARQDLASESGLYYGPLLQ